MSMMMTMPALHYLSRSVPSQRSLSSCVASGMLGGVFTVDGVQMLFKEVKETPAMIPDEVQMWCLWLGTGLGSDTAWDLTLPTAFLEADSTTPATRKTGKKTKRCCQISSLRCSKAAWMWGGCQVCNRPTCVLAIEAPQVCLEGSGA